MVRKTRNDLGLPQFIFLPKGRIIYVIATTSSKIFKYNLFCFAVLFKPSSKRQIFLKLLSN